MHTSKTVQLLPAGGKVSIYRGSIAELSHISTVTVCSATMVGSLLKHFTPKHPPSSEKGKRNARYRLQELQSVRPQIQSVWHFFWCFLSEAVTPHGSDVSATGMLTCWPNYQHMAAFPRLAKLKEVE